MELVTKEKKRETKIKAKQIEREGEREKGGWVKERAEYMQKGKMKEMQGKKK